MPSSIDVMMWDNPESEVMMLSPVSFKGLQFLRSLGGESTTIMVLTEGPAKFIPHVPPGVIVIFNNDDGKLVPIDAIKPLQ